MSQSYQKSCRDCKQEITMMEMNGKWGAYKIDGSFHKCKSEPPKQQQPKEQLKNLLEATLLLAEMETRLKRAEKMLFNHGT